LILKRIKKRGSEVVIKEKVREGFEK